MKPHNSKDFSGDAMNTKKQTNDPCCTSGSSPPAPALSPLGKAKRSTVMKNRSTKTAKGASRAKPFTHKEALDFQTEMANGTPAQRARLTKIRAKYGLPPIKAKVEVAS